MGIKLEYIIIIVSILIVYFTMTIELTNSVSKSTNMHKELEFVNTTFIEVNTEKKYAQLYTPHGIRINGVLVLDYLNYYTPTIKLLVADKGTYKGDILYLDGNVSLKETVGNLYKTEHANYNQKKEILNITSSYVAYMGENIFRGESLVYDVLKKEAYATKIDAVVYTAQK